MVDKEKSKNISVNSEVIGVGIVTGGIVHQIFNNIPIWIKIIILLIPILILILLYQKNSESEKINSQFEKLINHIEKFENKLVENKKMDSNESKKNEIQNDIEKLDELISDIEYLAKSNNNENIGKELHNVEFTLDRIMKKYAGNTNHVYQKNSEKQKKNFLVNENLDNQVKNNMDVEIEDINSSTSETISLLFQKEKEINNEEHLYVENREQSIDNEVFNDENSFVPVENTNDENLYNMKLNVAGRIDYNFDGNGLYSTKAPELFAKVKINGVENTMLSGKTSYVSSDILKNVSLKAGDEIEVTIFDDDTIIARRWNELHSFKFKFDGEKIYNDSESLSTTLEFFKEGEEIVNTTTYSVNVVIEGDIYENKDEGKTLPDFSGAIYVEGKAYSIIKKSNQLVNEQVVKNVAINLGDMVSIIVVEEDVLWTPKTIMKHNFIFDGNEVMKENQKVKLYLDFVE